MPSEIFEGKKACEEFLTRCDTTEDYDKMGVRFWLDTKNEEHKLPKVGLLAQFTDNRKYVCCMEYDIISHGDYAGCAENGWRTNVIKIELLSDAETTCPTCGQQHLPSK